MKRMWPVCVMLFFLGAFVCAAGPAANLLKNGSFEIPGKGGVPASWQREYNPVLSGPFRVVSGADDRSELDRHPWWAGA